MAILLIVAIIGDVVLIIVVIVCYRKNRSRKKVAEPNDNPESLSHAHNSENNVSSSAAIDLSIIPATVVQSQELQSASVEAKDEC